MQQTFEHLLGLPAAAAVAILAASGITNVEVVPTAAPPRKHAAAREEGYGSTRVVAVEDDGRKLIVSRFLTGDPRREERKDADEHTVIRPG